METTGNPTDLPVPGPAREQIGERVTIFRRQERWYAEFFLNKKQHRQSLKTGNLRRARQEGIRIEAKLQEGCYRAPERAPLLPDLVPQYLDYLKVEGRAATTLKRYTPELKRLVEFFTDHGAKRVSDLSVKLVDEYRAWRVEAKAEPATIHHECVLIKQLANFAIRRGLITSSPLSTMKLKKPARTVQPVYTLEQVDAILAHSSKTWRPVFEFLACTGLRIGELCWLTWNDIDEKNCFIHVRAKANWKPKDKEDRKIPVNDRLTALLKSLKRGKGWVFCAKPGKKHPEGGQQIRDRHALASLKTALRRAGIPAGSLHTFRHFFVCHCLLNGVAPNVVAQWTGHASMEMILHYFHLLKDQSTQAMMKVSFVSAPPTLPASAAGGQGGGVKVAQK
jgi:site-specific recombinase XerD